MKTTVFTVWQPLANLIQESFTSGKTTHVSTVCQQTARLSTVLLRHADGYCPEKLLREKGRVNCFHRNKNTCDLTSSHLLHLLFLLCMPLQLTIMSWCGFWKDPWRSRPSWLFFWPSYCTKSTRAEARRVEVNVSWGDGEVKPCDTITTFMFCFRKQLGIFSLSSDECRGTCNLDY